MRKPGPIIGILAGLVLALAGARPVLPAFESPGEAERIRAELARVLAPRQGMWTEERKSTYAEGIIQQLQDAPQRLKPDQIDRFLQDFSKTRGFTSNNDPEPTAVWFDMEVELTRKVIQHSVLPRFSQTPEVHEAIQAQKAGWLEDIRRAVHAQAVYLPGDLVESFIAEVAEPRIAEALNDTFRYAGVRPLTASEQITLKTLMKEVTDARTLMQKHLLESIRQAYAKYQVALQGRVSGSAPKEEQEARIEAARQVLFRFLSGQFVGLYRNETSKLLEPEPGPIERELARKMREEVQKEFSQPIPPWPQHPDTPDEDGPDERPKPPVVSDGHPRPTPPSNPSSAGSQKNPSARPHPPHPEEDAAPGTNLWIAGVLAVLALALLAWRGIRRSSPQGKTGAPGR